MPSHTSSLPVVFLDTYAASPEGFATVYCDGSSTGRDQGAAGWSWYRNDFEWGAGGIVCGTNNIAEITALMEALRNAEPDEPLVVVSDSRYAIGAVCEWYEGWERRGWRTSTGGDVANVDLIRAARRALVDRPGTTMVKHVRGHGKDKSARAEDIHGNRLADLLAKEARLATAAAGQPTHADPMDWEIVHGRGRRKLPFIEALDA